MTNLTGQIQTAKIITELKRAGVYRPELNIVGLEGLKFKNGQFILTDDKPDQWNDCFIIIVGDQIVDAVLGTTEPGSAYTYKPLNSDGCARIAFGSYKNVYKIGIHGNKAKHEALVQCGNITVCRDLNKDFSRQGDKMFTGDDFYVNFHSTPSGASEDSIGYWSAGCSVTYDYAQFKILMERFKEAGFSRFSYSLFDGSAVTPGSAKPLKPAIGSIPG
jgi:hypothetical protein